MDYSMNLTGRSACDEHARAFVARWSASAGGELGNFQMFYTELADVLGLPHPDPSVGGTGDYVFERAVTFPDGRRGRADLFKAGCAVVEAKCFGSVTGTVSKHTEARGQRRLVAGRGSPAWERGMLAAARQGVRYARALAPYALAPPFVIALDIGFAFDLHHDASGTGRGYARYSAARRILVADLVRKDVRETLRLVLTDPYALTPGGRRRAGGRGCLDRPALTFQHPLTLGRLYPAGAGGVVLMGDPPSWPALLAEQACAVRRVVTEVMAPVTVADVVSAFEGAGPAAVTAVLDALAALGLVRTVEGGCYAA